MLKLVLPKGSLEKATFQLFEEADLTEDQIGPSRIQTESKLHPN